MMLSDYLWYLVAFLLKALAYQVFNSCEIASLETGLHDKFIKYSHELPLSLNGKIIGVDCL